MDKDKDREMRDEFIEYLKQNSERRIQELNQLYGKQIENQEKLYQAIIDEKEQNIKILEQQNDELKQQIIKKESQLTQYNFQGASFRGGLQEETIQEM